MITLLVMTDGRDDCLRHSVPTLQRLHGPVTRRVIHDDTGDPDHHKRLADWFPDWDIIATVRRSGFGGAYRHAQEWLAHATAEPFIFSTEDDFQITRDVDLVAAADVLTRQPYLAQLALRRQPWNDVERAAGGIVESRATDYVDRADDQGREWLEHRLFWTTNPSLYPRRILDHPWPTVPQSEGIFSLRLFTDPAIRCGFWGARQSGEWCHHIGHERVGHGY